MTLILFTQSNNTTVKHEEKYKIVPRITAMLSKTSLFVFNKKEREKFTNFMNSTTKQEDTFT